MIIAVSTCATIDRTAGLDPVLGASTILSLAAVHQQAAGTGVAVAAQLAQLEADVVLVAAAPADSRLGSLLDGQNIPHRLVAVDRPLSGSFRVDSMAGAATGVNRSGFHPVPGEADKLSRMVVNTAGEGDIVFITGPDDADECFYQTIVRDARTHFSDITIALDCRDNPSLLHLNWPADIRPDWIICTSIQPEIARAVEVELQAAGGRGRDAAVTAVAERIALDHHVAAGVVVVSDCGRAYVASSVQQFVADVAKNNGVAAMGVDQTVARILHWSDR
ncbi:hypothetical protein ACFSSC_04590 [Corynebacterium mendelii]|uniref:Uncharacterized protein n=1 Tax=Corynebacterium mendelii TaxID=2765362 RepID=A0A939DZY3_9CORY|nr:hypothetical protein [Corynebacterium mendelii]MBN9643323.1 hypothetical protein [Corynebacterium mendelii]